jgi:hypothetical protein
MCPVLEFLTRQTPETSLAGIGTSRCFPTAVQQSGATDCNGGTTARLMGEAARDASSVIPQKARAALLHDACTVGSPVTRGNRSPLGFAISRSRVQHFGITSKRLVN